jgi:hypothetical protein
MTEAEWLVSNDLVRMLDLVGDRASDRKLRLYVCGCCRAVWDFLLPAAREAITVIERFVDEMATDAEREAAFRDLVVAEGGQCFDEPDGSRSACVNARDWGTVAVGLAVMLDTDLLWDRMSGRPIAGPGSSRPQGRFWRTNDSCGAALECAAVHALWEREARRGVVGRVWKKLVRSANQALGGSWGWPFPRQLDYEREVGQQRTWFRDIFGNPFQSVTVDPAWLTSDVVALARSVYDGRAFD